VEHKSYKRNYGSLKENLKSKNLKIIILKDKSQTKDLRTGRYLDKLQSSKNGLKIKYIWDIAKKNYIREY